jgi:hypothetical protein
LLVNIGLDIKALFFAQQYGWPTPDAGCRAAGKLSIYIVQLRFKFRSCSIYISSTYEMYPVFLFVLCTCLLHAQVADVLIAVRAGNLVF